MIVRNADNKLTRLRYGGGTATFSSPVASFDPSIYMHCDKYLLYFVSCCLLQFILEYYSLLVVHTRTTLEQTNITSSRNCFL